MAADTQTPPLRIVKRKGWWNDPEKWLDIEDIQVLADVSQDQRTPAAIAMVVEFLRDRGTHRPLETNTYIKLFLRALNNIHLDAMTLTDKQHRTINLYTQAKRRGLIPAQHIAEIEGISVVGAYKRIQRFRNKAEVYNFSNLLTIYSNEPEPEYAPIPLNKIRSVQRGLRVRCAGDGLQDCAGWARGDIGVCPSCYEKAKFSDWLEEHRKFVLRESYAEAKAIIERGDDSERASTTYERIAEAA